MQDQDGANGHAAGDGFQHLNQSLERTLDQNRALLEEMACFAKDEALRLAQMQMEQANQAFTRFRDRRDLTGLIDAQQDWIRQMTQDYAALSLRYAEMFHRMAQHLKIHFGAGADDLHRSAEDDVEDIAEDLARMAPAANGMSEDQSPPPAE